MRRIILITFVMIFILAGNLFAASAKSNVAILYNGKSQVNRNTLHLLGSKFSAYNLDYNFKAFDKPGKVKSSKYKAVIILNTGVEKGIDPIFLDFINSSTDKSNIIMVSLYKGQNDLYVDEIRSDQNPYNVDVIASASIWRKPLFSSSQSDMTPQEMHNLWINKVISFLKSK